MHYGQEPLVNYVNYAISIGVIVLGIYTFRKDNEGFYSKSSHKTRSRNLLNSRHYCFGLHRFVDERYRANVHGNSI